MKKIILCICVLFNSLIWSASASENVETKSDLTERGIRLVSQAQYPQAIEILKIESAKGDADAAFWLGIAYFKSGDGSTAGGAFLRAAELGDPWAMNILSGGLQLYSGTICGLYDGWGCDYKWTDKALDRWDELAEQGDPDAIYVTTVFGFKWWEYFSSYTYPYLAARIEGAIANGGGYGFLGGFILKDKDLFKYLSMAANQGYAPAILGLGSFRGKFLTDEEVDELDHQALNLGYIPAAQTLYFKYAYNWKGRGETKSEREKAYYYGTMYAKFSGGRKVESSVLRTELTDKNGKRLYDEAGNQLYEEYFTEAEIVEIEQRAKDFLKKVKPDAFLTKNTRELLNIYN